jgi:hypothetical protein
MAQLTPDDIRRFLNDSPENNLLIDGVEFSDPRINQAIGLALSSFNGMQPITGYTLDTYPQNYVKVLYYLTAQTLYEGQAAMAARNQLTYSDGGLNIPIEERYEMFMSLANLFGRMASDLARQIKVQMNIESGWGSVSSDYANFPVW